MKYFCGIFFLLLLSCTDTQEKPPSQPRPKLEVRDSGVIKNEFANPFAPVDVSPLDMVYMPADYPIQKMSGKINTPPVARVIYSRPHRQGRVIFGNLLKYKEPWRLGANEATEIEFFQAVTIQNKKVERGRYVLYAIIQQDKWTIIFNSNLYSWGLKPDQSKDLFHFDVPVSDIKPTLEYFTIAFEKTASGADLMMAWENVIVRLPIQF